MVLRYRYCGVEEDAGTVVLRWRYCGVEVAVLWC